MPDILIDLDNGQISSVNVAVVRVTEDAIPTLESDPDGAKLFASTSGVPLRAILVATNDTNDNRKELLEAYQEQQAASEKFAHRHGTVLFVLALCATVLGGVEIYLNGEISTLLVMIPMACAIVTGSYALHRVAQMSTHACELMRGIRNDLGKP